MNNYYTLIVSLPRHNRHFKIKQTPISAIQLEKRLKLLSKKEQKILHDLMNVVWLNWFDRNKSIKETAMLANALYKLNNSFITNIIQWYFDIRSILVALRLRAMHKPLPTDAQNEWITRWNLRLIHNGNESDFRLSHAYPWLPEFINQFSRNNIANAEEILLTQLWQQLNSIENGHYFDFEAVIIYLLRWQIVNYWSQFDEVIAGDKINQLVNHIILNKKQ